MLARARAPPPSPFFLCSSSHLETFPFLLNYRRNGRKLPVCRVAYKRIPMDTPGAYQLIDEHTGEKFIVWGGSDDGGDDSVPSEQVLSWKPEAVKSSDSLVDDDRVARSLTGFSKLKASKIRGLMIKRSSGTRTLNCKENAPATNQEEPDFVRARTRFGLLHGKGRDGDIQDGSFSNVRPDFVGESSTSPGNASSSSSSSSLRGRGWGSASSSFSSESNTTAAARLPQRSRKSANGGFFSNKSFENLGCSPDMVQSLKDLQFIRPSHIQAMAYGPVLEGKSCIIADQSGSGKTLAYLVPTIQRLRQEELAGLHKSSARSPRVIILAPTAELASQVLNNCRSISKVGVPFRSMVATGGFRQKTQLDNLQQEMDVLIATPGRLIYLLQEGFLLLTNLRCVILDEVDILFGDEGFEQVLQTLSSSAPMSSQYLFVTATLPVDIYNKLVETFPDCEVIMGPGLHRMSSRLEEVLVDCCGDVEGEKSPETAFKNKRSALLQLFQESPVSRTIVFCNKIETCRKVENALKRFDRKGVHVKVLPFHAALDQETRLFNMKEFLNLKSTDNLFLICTDRASRGIDFTNVDHVVLFDFPRDPSEYVRRVGRTARGAMGKGKAFVFVVGKQVSLAKRIMERNRKGHPLHDVPSAYELES
ncbi:RNA helicase protein [Dioscorea alata]|uniref:RNA helicase protein n=2 Tax=Dioscorea alata TaxID=55571 RepID=A0ACB7U4U2_DIOAL|nr:RNA helicase protein [Dioscorea alata]